MRLVASLLPPGAILALDEQIPLFQYHRLVAAFGADRLRDGGLSYPAAHAQVRGGDRPDPPCDDLTLGIHERVRAQHAARRDRFRGRRLHRRRASPAGADEARTFAIVRSARRPPCRMRGRRTDLERWRRDPPSTRVAASTATILISPARMSSVTPGRRVGADLADRARGAGRGCSRRHASGRPVRPSTAPRATFWPVTASAELRPSGLPHRAGHGARPRNPRGALIVRGQRDRLEPGMCFSVEPMIVVPVRFGVRLEDHVFMTDAGPNGSLNRTNSPSARTMNRRGPRRVGSAPRESWGRARTRQVTEVALPSAIAVACFSRRRSQLPSQQLQVDAGWRSSATSAVHPVWWEAPSPSRCRRGRTR